MTTAMSEIVSRLPKLSPVELGQIKKRIDALISLGTTTSINSPAPETDRTDTSDEGFVLEVVCETVLRVSGGSYTVPMMRKQPPTMKALRAHLPGLLKYLKNVDKAQRRGFLALGVEMVYHNLQHLNLPANAPMVIKHLHRIPALVDTHFPGYYTNGLLRHIIRMGR